MAMTLFANRVIRRSSNLVIELFHLVIGLFILSNLSIQLPDHQIIQLPDAWRR